ncbi:MAG: DUF6116 family protein [Lysobacteraceae bacterium]
MLKRFLERLRYPQLFALFAALFALDLFIPDPVPFFDEIMLALGTALLGSLKKRDRSKQPEDSD